MIAALATRMTGLARRVCVGHHAQGGTLLLLLTLVLLYRSPAMGLALAVFWVMQMCYGGHGTFQDPLRAGKQPGLLDIVIVAAGTFSLVLYLFLLIALPLQALLAGPT